MKTFKSLLTPEQVFFYRNIPQGPPEEGRQGTGYTKKVVVDHSQFAALWELFPPKQKLSKDAYILEYPPGAYIPLHLDPVEDGLEHHRLNILLQGPQSGGTLYLEGQVNSPISLHVGDGYLFRPDVTPHEVKVIEGGVSRIVLSLGALCYEDK